MQAYSALRQTGCSQHFPYCFGGTLGVTKVSNTHWELASVFYSEKRQNNDLHWHSSTNIESYGT